MAKASMGGGSLVKTGRMTSANMTGAGMEKALADTKMSMGGKGPGAPKTELPKATPKVSAIAPKVQGSKGATTKDPMKNGQGRKLGNHW